MKSPESTAHKLMCKHNTVIRHINKFYFSYFLKMFPICLYVYECINLCLTMNIPTGVFRIYFTMIIIHVIHLSWSFLS